MTEERHIPTLTIGGLQIARLGREAMAKLMARDVRDVRLGKRTKPRVIVSANGMVVACYHRQPALRAVFDQVDVIDADGMPMVMASRLLCNEPLPERTATTDFLIDACKIAEAENIRFFFLGARPGVAARAAQYLRHRFPRLKIVGTRNGFFDTEELPVICSAIRDAGTDVLWLGMGLGRQEALALRMRAELPEVAWIRTCGGLFDHYGGGVSRAPKWMQSAGLEWLYRAAREPVRLGWRYLATNPVAAYYLLTKTSDR